APLNSFPRRELNLVDLLRNALARVVPDHPGARHPKARPGASITTTLDTYGHLWDRPGQRRDADRLPQSRPCYSSPTTRTDTFWTTRIGGSSAGIWSIPMQ